MNDEFKRGLRRGLPIGLGYITVSIAFGIMAVSGGISVWNTIMISATNLTSAAQFAGAGLIISGAPLYEIAITTLVINIRYLLMSFSVLQKLKMPMPVWKRLIFGFGITDETFTLAVLEKDELTFEFMMGLITLPYIGWALGTVVGALLTNMLPLSVQKCLAIALYAMFIALIIPATKRSKEVTFVVTIAVVSSIILKFLPISSGFSIIICAVFAAALGAKMFPKEVEE